MPELNEQIRTYIDTIAPAVAPRAEEQQPWWRSRPLVAVVFGAVIVTLPSLLLWGLLGRQTEPEPTNPQATTVATIPATVTITPTTSAPPTTAPPVLETIGSWETIPDAPRPQDDSVRVWTGSELIVWGDERGVLEQPAVGMAYNATTGQWRDLAAAPDSRSQPAAVWTGSRLLIWGGWSSTTGQLTNDGFAYDPSTDEWSAIPAAPLSPRSYSFHVWTGAEMIVWGGMEAIDEFMQTGTTGGAAYNPVTGEWRKLSEAPLGSRNPGVGVWTGEVMIIGGNGDDTDGDDSWAAYDPQSDSWTQLPEPPVRSGGVYDGVWTGTEVIFSRLNHESDAGQPHSDVFAFNPATNEWRQAAAPGVVLEGTGFAWTGNYLVYWGRSGFPDSTPVELAYDPHTDTWSRLTPAPLHVRLSYGKVTAAQPGTLIVWGGSNAPSDPELADGAILAINPEPVDTATSASDIELISSLIRLGGDLGFASDLPWDPAGVGLGLGPNVLRTVDPADLTDPHAWELDVEQFRAATGPFSVLDGLARLAPVDDLLVQVGSHNHCASPPEAAPAGLEGLRRVSVQPSSTESCLMWWTIDVFVTEAGHIRAITYDFWEP